MTDGDLTGAAEARGRARALLAKAAERRAGARPIEQQLELEAARDRLQSTAAVSGLHDLLRDLAAYLGDRPQKDREAMALYGRVMAMLGTGAE